MPTTLELFQQLADLAEKYPEQLEEAKREHPEWWQVILDEQREMQLLERVKHDTADGYFAYYEGKYGFEPPHQVRKWVTEIYAAHERGMGYSINGYRGSWKSVSVSATFTEFRIGQNPEKTNLVICANDDSADKIVKNITQTIGFHPFWKKAFPHVVPHNEKGWSSEGYYVRDTNYSIEDWTERQAKVIDPSLVGGGYTSTRINGKHPNGCLITDDLHGLNNSTSETERKFVVKFYTQELSKTMVRENDKLVTWPINVGVPWGKDDTHQVLGKSGGYVCSSVPVMTRAKENEGVYIDGKNTETGAVYDDIVGWWTLTNPDRFGVQSIIHDRGLGKYDFWQMMMMDLSAASAGGIKYYVYPKGDIDTKWPCVSGVDPSYTFRERREFERKSSAFAMANVLKRPRGGAVLQGGVLEQCSTQIAAGYMAAAKAQFLNHLFFAVENVGIGLLFLQTMKLINPSLVIVGSDLGGIRGKGEKAGRARDKSTRTKTELAPWLENATIFISDERSEFLDAIRDGLDNFSELDPGKADKRWDAIDSFYHAVKAMPDVLQQIPVGEELPSVFKKQAKPHPLAGRRERNNP